MDLKYGPKVIPGWNNYYLSFILPTSWTDNDVRCNRCYKRFFSPIIPDYCSSCIEYYPVDMTCTKCDKIEHVTPKAFKKHDNKCVSCFNSSIYDFKCYYCIAPYLDSHNSFNMLNEHVCFKCRENVSYKKKLLLDYDKNHNALIDSILQLHDNIYINVTYKGKFDYSGFCYYHDNYYTERTVDDNDDNNDNMITHRFPLMKIFEISDVSKLISNSDFINFYSIPDKLECENGCSRYVYNIHSVLIFYQ